MLSDDTKEKLANIIQGLIIEGQTDHLSAAGNFLCRSFSTSTKIEKNFDQQSAIKEKQAKCLVQFIDEQQLWLDGFPIEENYLTEGGEARVFWGEDKRTVVKLNDAIYYNTWLDFLNSVLIHNLLFEETAYTLNGVYTKK